MEEIIKEILLYTGFGVGVATFITMVVKPIRNSFVEWINCKTGTHAQNEQIIEISQKIDEMYSVFDAKLNKTSEQYTNQIALLSDCELVSLRNRITQMYYKYKNSNTIPLYEKENLIKHYELYKRLGGNSYVTEIYLELMSKKTI